MKNQGLKALIKFVFVSPGCVYKNACAEQNRMSFHERRFEYKIGYNKKAPLKVSFIELRASSYEPGELDWLGFRDLASPLFSL